MLFKKLKEPIVTSDIFYDIFEGGYIVPEKILKSKEEAKRVRDAIEVIKTFMEEAEEKGIIELC